MKNIYKKLILMLVVWFILPSALAYAGGQPTIVSSDVDAGTNSATLSGSVNPNGSSTNAWYETPNSGSLQLQNIGSGTSDFPLLPYNLTGLTPNTTYRFRIVASNINGIVNGNWITFTTYVDPQSDLPDIISEDVNQGTTSATISGEVNPNGSSTNAWYETPNSGSLQLQNIGSGTSDFPLLPYNLTGLTPNTTYRFRIVASNINGIVNGNWITFTTDDINNNSCNTSIPTISSISPDHVTEGANSATVTITGTNFTSSSDALFEGSNRTTTFLSSTSLKIVLTSADLDQDGNFDISVTNSTNCTSNDETFTVNNQSSGGGGGGGGSSSSDPDVITENSTSVDEDSATLNSTIDPNNRSTTAWFEYGTNSNLSNSDETNHISQGSGNGAEDFSQSVSNLDSNTRYYFRAVANNSGGTTKGSIKSFTTENDNGANTGIITTVQATNKSSSSAKLNAIFLNQNNADAEGYFEYGTNLSLNSETNNRDLGNNTSVTFSDTITNLSPNTIYYFRAVVEKNGEKYTGNRLVFQTNGTGTITTQPVATNDSEEATIITEKSEILTITNDADNYQIGDTVEYLITFENISSKDFENTIVSVQLPEEIEFSSSNYGESSGNTVSFDAGTLVSRQVGSMTIFGTVVSKLSNNMIVTTAIMTYENEGSNLENTEIAYVTNKILGKDDNSSLAGNALFGFGTFLPGTLLGWLLLIVIILAILLLARRYLLPARYQTSEQHDAHNSPHH